MTPVPSDVASGLGNSITASDATDVPGDFAEQMAIKTEYLTRVDAALSASAEATGPEVMEPLPPPPANLAGTSSASGKSYRVTVSNKAGYLCHVHVEANWPVTPEVTFAIFTHPDHRHISSPMAILARRPFNNMGLADNSALFRDVKRVGARRVLKAEPGYKEVEVEQLGDIKVLWMHRTYSTWLRVVEDSRDPECLRIAFDLLKSDVLGKFSGRWELRPVRDPVSGLVVRSGHANGRTTEAVLRELCGAVSEVAHVNGAVASFAFDPAGSDDDGESEEEGEEEGEEVAAGGGSSEVKADRISEVKADPRRVAACRLLGWRPLGSKGLGECVRGLWGEAEDSGAELVSARRVRGLTARQSGGAEGTANASVPVVASARTDKDAVQQLLRTS
ncbi:hypothetical protein VOLCADRAFT_97186 [Volvox carteri f. nagariensis]|uniref:Uncharacterized protein n=1 Tax=Volvox carteri f. nagariensis TaxID=3068 RepID=D8UC37_VOLCA|nr:uncharacterized protein VOLCADRAFT_97186 [Volvox carteri f. nagariensis]EFJ42728.1 hypothetical protein VOLCADRAFT_97186 [Volvox carteri f. nagariensis]|eukprot:XP_002956189.1 hypothetical protein VOLCADRAFT_97186 [Volvox carteri f. nagariensis]